MQCSQSPAWTMNRSLSVASCVNVFPGRLSNSSSTQPIAAHLHDGEIGCHQCIILHSGNDPASPDMRPTPVALSRMRTIHHLHPCNKTQATVAMTNYTKAPTVINSAAFLAQLWSFLDRPQVFVVTQQQQHFNITTNPKTVAGNQRSYLQCKPTTPT